MGKTHKQMLREVTQEGGTLPDGYTFDPKHDPPIYKTGSRDDPRTQDDEDTVVQVIPTVDTGDTDDAAGQE